MSSFDLAIPVIIHHEAYQRPDGSWEYWSNDPDDPGGETAWGFSLLIIRREGLTAQDLGIENWNPGCLKAMTQDTAQMLYKRLFWDRFNYGAIESQKPATKVMDCSVNCGPGRSHMMAQRAAISASGAPLIVDGILGPKSIGAINACDPTLWMACMVNEMTTYYNALMAKKPKLEKYRNNWLRRAGWIG